MQNTQSFTPAIKVNSTQAVVGAVLVGAGCLMGMAGAIVGGHAILSATRRWFRELEVPPTEVVKHKWNQTKAASTAGAQAWHGSNGMKAHSARA
jgi:hypothetical protein